MGAIPITCFDMTIVDTEKQSENDAEKIQETFHGDERKRRV